MGYPDHPLRGRMMVHRSYPLITILFLIGIFFLPGAEAAGPDIPLSSPDDTVLLLAAGPVINTSGGDTAQVPPEPGRHGVTDTLTATLTTVVPGSTVPITSVPGTTPVPVPSTTSPLSNQSMESPTSPPGQSANTIPSTDVFLALLAGIALGSFTAILEYRKHTPLYQEGNRTIFALAYALIAVGVIGSILITQGIGQNWLLLVPILQAGILCSSIALVGGYLTEIRLSSTLLFQGVGSMILALIILFTLVQPGQNILSPYALVLYTGSGGISLWQLVLARKSAAGTSEPTLSLPQATDPHPVTAMMADKYSDIELIAVGGLARVYRARRKKDGMVVAVKVPLNTSEVTGMSFMKEILLWQSLSHPNIVSITDASILPFPAVEMEYIPRSLADVNKPVDISMAIKFIIGIADGLAYAHKKGVIHRDIKPENILITPDNTPKITDWGMSRILDSTMPTVVGFSVSYAAPEQVSPSRFGSTDKRTDIFQLGVVFYELVTGSQPFKGEDIGRIISAILDQDPVPPSKIVPAAGPVEPIILTCLAKNPADRYQSVDELLIDLKALSQLKE
jgi:hypothetical protein